MRFIAMIVAVLMSFQASAFEGTPTHCKQFSEAIQAIRILREKGLGSEDVQRALLRAYPAAPNREVYEDLYPYLVEFTRLYYEREMIQESNMEDVGITFCKELSEHNFE